MTDYKEEQSYEVEALQSIYPEEFEVLSSEPFYKFQITVTSEDTNAIDDEEGEKLVATLEVTYTANYPDEEPIYQIIPNDMLTETHLEKLNGIINEQISENLGMAMVFTMVSAVQEFLNERVDEMKKGKEEERDRQEEVARQAEEERTNKLKGTPVTIESFLAWKEKFDEEMAVIKNEKYQQDKGKGLTGKELFFQDSNLDTSDMALLDEGDQVEVDESLFQELDDLDLDEELDS